MAIACSTRLESPTCSFLIERRSSSLVYARIAGHDVGEFGDLPMRCIEACRRIRRPSCSSTRAARAAPP